MNYIMVSGHQEKHLKKAIDLDGIIMLNLEDGVPKDKKNIALKNIIDFLHIRHHNVIVRINPLNEGGKDEIKKLSKFNIPIRIPKINSLKDLNEIIDIVDDIHLSIETKESFFNLKTFQHKKISSFYLGILDLFDDLGLDHNLITLENQLIHKILIDFSLNCRYLGKKPIGFVYQKYKDTNGFKKWCEIQKNYGFCGVGCITPTQLQIANEIFTNKNIEYAKMIVERFEREGPFTIDGLYVDEPIYKNYKQMIK